jgi:hypothetical protein
MGIGLLILVSVGKENLYLSAQPEITFFKIAYKRHTNFSTEPTPQYFKTTPDFGRRCTVNISKNADLLSMTYLYIELPNIQLENFNNQQEFAWVSKIGLAIINFIELEIGGTIIDRHYNDWMNIWFELTNNSGNIKGYNKMIGNVPELTNYSQTKQNYILYIPLCFWFCLDTGLSLPLISLINNDVKFHIDFNDFENCYNISPSCYITINNNYCLLNKGDKFYQIIDNNKNIGEFIYFDSLTQQLYYNPIKGTFIIPTSDNDNNLKLINNNTNFSIYIQTNSIIINNTNYFKYNTPSINNSYILANYVYLDNFEREKFINNKHEYIIPVIQTLSEQIIYSANINYKLTFTDPIKLLAWRVILLANINSNKIFNYTSTPYTDIEEDLINNNLIVINSINRIELNSIEYYTLIQKYQYNLINSQKGIYMYSFGCNPKDVQPAGTLNFSKLNDAYLQLNMNKKINYQNPATLRCYGIQYNLLKIQLGICIYGFNSTN